MNEKKWLIYGANGYSGKLAVEEALRRGLKPVLAGRSDEVKKIAQESELDCKIFRLESIDSVSEKIAGFTVVANCAGPFSKTAETMIQACIKSNVHYIDITGEIAVYDYANQCDNQALAAGVVLCPGVGSDVIPTDCLAVYLKDSCPDATHLTMAWHVEGSRASKGTAKTSVEGMFKGGKVRKNGKIIQVPLAYKERLINFEIGKKNAMTIPWGDVFTAYHSTGIPNIEFYFSRPRKSVKRLKRFRSLLPLFDRRWIIKMIQNRIERNWKQPTNELRKNAKSYFWGEVINQNGNKVQAQFTTADGYDVTAVGTVVVAEYLLKDHNKKSYYTPSILMGKSLVEKLPGYSGIEFL